MVQVGRIQGATLGAKKDDLSVLAPLHALWHDENFQTAWVKAMKADLQNFKEALFDMNFQNLSTTDVKTWTERLGLPIPEKPEDYHVALMCLRSIVRYNEWKLEVVERAASRYVEFQQLAIERERVSRTQP